MMYFETQILLFQGLNIYLVRKKVFICLQMRKLHFFCRRFLVKNYTLAQDTRSKYKVISRGNKTQYSSYRFPLKIFRNLTEIINGNLKLSCWCQDV